MRMIVTRRTRYFTFIISIFYFLLICVVLLSNSVRTTGAINSVTAQVRFLFPQHWAFFTKANTVYTELYLVEHGKLQKINANRGSAFNDYGFGKQSRILKAMLKNFKRRNQFIGINNEEELQSYLMRTNSVRNDDFSLFKMFKGKQLALIVQPIKYKMLSSFQYPLKICRIYVPG
jgi:hypothetical protein